MRVRGRERPETMERRLEVASQLQRIEPLVERFELRVRGTRENTGGGEPLVGRLGLVKLAVHAGSRTRLTDELLDRLEEVHVQPGELVDASELRIGGFGGAAIIADELPDDGAVLLLDVRTVVLLPGAAARKHNALAPPVVEQRAVDELRPVVAVEAGQGHRQAFANLVHAAAPARLALAPQGLQFDPAGRDIDRTEREQEEVARGAATMSDQIDFEEAGARVVALGERANGDLLLEPGAGPRGRGPAQWVAGARRRQQARERRPTGLSEQFVERGTGGELAALDEPIE